MASGIAFEIERADKKVTLKAKWPQTEPKAAPEATLVHLFKLDACLPGGGCQLNLPLARIDYHRFLKWRKLLSFYYKRGARRASSGAGHNDKMRKSKILQSNWSTKVNKVSRKGSSHWQNIISHKRALVQNHKTGAERTANAMKTMCEQGEWAGSIHLVCLFVCLLACFLAAVTTAADSNKQPTPSRMTGSNR